LKAAALEIAEPAVLVAIAGRPNINQQARHWTLLMASHPADGADGVSFYQGGNDSGAFIDAQPVHNIIMRQRSRIVKTQRQWLTG